jgi:hypothetical protein
MSILCSMVGASFTVAVTTQVLRAKKTITAVGNAQVSTAQSQFGGASYLGDGTGDFLTVDNLSSDVTGNFTYECWVRFNALPTSGNFQMLMTGDGNRYLGLLNNGGTQRWESSVMTGSNQYVARYTPSITTGVWYHIALVKSGSTLTFYQNGTSVSGTTIAGSMDSSSTLFTSGTNILGAYTSNNFSLNGWMDEVRISNDARYTSNFTAPTAPFVNDANTVLLIHANGTNASTVFEDDNGIGRSQVGISAFANAQISTAQSKFGGSSAYFDGVQDRLQVGTTDGIFFTGDFTIEMWFRAGNETGMLFGNTATNVSPSAGQFISYYSPSPQRLEIYFNGQSAMVTNTAMAIDTWHHIALVRSGSTVRSYVNGTQQTDTKTVTGDIGTATYPTWYLGGLTNDADCMLGYMDEIRFSNSARYTTTFTPSTTPFVNDANTVLLIHADGTNASTAFTDDNAQLTVTPAAASVNEGSSLTFNVSTINTADQTLYYSLTNAGDFATSSGSFSLANNAGSFSVTPTADTTTEGAETFTAQIRTGSTSGPIITTSSAVTINDTSLTAITLPPASVKLGTSSAGAGYADEGITDGVTSSSTGFTFSAWVYPTLTGHGDSQWPLISLPNQDGGNASLFISIRDNGNLRVYRQVPGIEGADYDNLVSGAFPTANTWYHLVISGQVSSTFVVYINGIQKTSLQYGGGISSNNFQLQILTGVRIGSNTSPQPAKGDQITQVWFDNSNVGITANLTKFYNNGFVDMGTQGTSSGLSRPLMYHYGNTSTFPTNNGRTSASTGNYLTYNLLDNDFGTIVNGT